MAVNYWTAESVYVPRAVYRRLKMLAEEINTLDGHVDIENVDELVAEILTEYCRQHFEESTKAVAQMFKCSRCK